MDDRGKEGMRGHASDYMKQTPYGTWHSPLGASDLAGSSITLNYVQVANGVPYWIESRPADGGRNVLVTNATADGSVRDLTPAGFSARSRVHEYGGKPYAIGRDVIFFSNFSDQRVYAQRAGQAPVALTPEGYRYADYELMRSGNATLLRSRRPYRQRRAQEHYRGTRHPYGRSGNSAVR